jgi:hypothetical protein
MKNEDRVSNDGSPARWACVLALLLVATKSMTVSATDWRQFRGPNGSGIAAADAQPATTCSDSQNFTRKLARDDSDFNGTPATVVHQVFLRSNRLLYCIETGAGG